MAYAMAPLVLKKYTGHRPQYNGVIADGLLLAIQVMFDPRIAVLTLLAVLLYRIVVGKGSIRNFLLSLGVPMLLATALHLYWLIPLIANPSVVGRQLSEVTSAAVTYLSFATFSQTLSLLHPNWPENIFGKVYFMRPEFLVLPILAFSSLLFLTNPHTNTRMRFFALLSLVGAFLAKGVREPFGGVYLWLFENVPGFQLFRDPTKFYLYGALGYAVLIPHTLEKMSDWLKRHVNHRFSFIPHSSLFRLAEYRRACWTDECDRKTNVSGRIPEYRVSVLRGSLFIIFLLFWAFTIREAVMGKLTGTFTPLDVPKEYGKLKDFLLSQPEYVQVGWYPQKSRFTFEDALHPSVEVRALDQDAVRERAIRYLVVPLDARGEIFVTDRVYDEVKHQEAITAVATLSGVRRLDEFTALAVFEVSTATP